MGFAIADVRLDGWVPSPPSERDYRTVFRDEAAPDRVDLRPYCTTVENQGQIGSCTANAAVGALEYHFNRRDGRPTDLSRMFVYYNTRRMRGQINFDRGARIREAMAALVAFGACREEVWPYNPGLFAAEPSSDAYDDARAYEAIQYARVDGVQGAVSALGKGLPVVFGTFLPHRCYVEAASTGVIPMPTAEERGGQRIGGHAMLIVGYEKPERLFLVRNSWGEGWGDRGYCRIPFEALTEFSMPEDFWVVAAPEPNGGFQMIRPAHESAEAPRPASARPAAPASLTETLRAQIRSGLDTDLAAASRKIEALLSKPTGARSARSPNVLPCTACAGTGLCPFCQGQSTACARCSGTRNCSECGGTGTV